MDVTRQFAIAVPIKKSDPIRGLVTGWAALSTDADGRPVIDHDDQWIPIEELEKAVHQAFAELNGRGRAGDMHERTGVADIVESMIIDGAKRDAFGFGPGPEGWLVTLKVHDPKVLAEVLRGEKLELSLRGMGRAIKMGESDA